MVWRKLGIVTAMVIAAQWRLKGLTRKDALVRAAYGKGGTCFYAGQLLEAERFLSEAIHAGSRDPRCFYFRGLAMLRTGQSAAAEGDFRMAAALEVQHAGVFDVGQALARVQGADRLKLEEIRRETKLAMQPQQPAAAETEETAATAPPIRPRTPGVQFEVTDFSQLPADPTDPFAGDTNDALTHDITPVESAPAAAGSGSEVASESSDEQDFGSDVDNLFSSGEDAPDGANPFLDEGGDVAADTASAPGSSGAPGATTGALKSVFRSFLNMAPSVPSTPSIPIPGMSGGGFPGGPGPEDFPGGDVPPEGFGPPGGDSSGTDEFGFPDETAPNGPMGADSESDPFGTPDDPFSTPATEPNTGNTGFDENPFPDAAE